MASANRGLNIELGANSAKFVDAMEKAKRSTMGLQTTITALKFDALTSLAQKAYSTAQRVYQLADSGMKLLQLEESFKAVATSIGVDSDALLSSLEKASKGTVDASDIMKASLMGLSEGLKADQLIKLMETATLVSRKMGVDVSEAYNSIIQAVVTLRTRGLVQMLGTVLDLDRIYKDYALTLGVNVKYLTEYAKQQALANAVIAKGVEMEKTLGTTMSARQQLWQTFKKDVHEIWEWFTKLVAVVGLGLAGAFILAQKTWYELAAKIKFEILVLFDLLGKLPDALGGSKFRGWAGDLRDSISEDQKKIEEQIKKYDTYRTAVYDTIYGSRAWSGRAGEGAAQPEPAKVDYKQMGEDRKKFEEALTKERLGLIDDGEKKELALLEHEKQAKIKEAKECGAKVSEVVEIYEKKRNQILAKYADQREKARQDENKKLIDFFNEQAKKRNDIVVEGMQYEAEMAKVTAESYSEKAAVIQKEYDAEIKASVLLKDALEQELAVKKAAHKQDVEMAKLRKETDEAWAKSGTTYRHHEFTTPVEDTWTPLLEKRNQLLLECKRSYYGLIGDLESLKRIEKEELEVAIEGLKTKNEWTQSIEESMRKTLEVKQLQRDMAPIKGFIDSVGDAWTNIFSNMADSTKSFSDRIKDVFRSLADSVLSMIAKMMFQWMLFMALSGITNKSGTNLASAFGLTDPTSGVGGILNFFKGFAEGGVATKPTFGVFGEKGPEALIPLEKVGGMGTTYIIINANDAKSFDDMVRRNPDSVMGVVRNHDRLGRR